MAQSLTSDACYLDFISRLSSDERLDLFSSTITTPLLMDKVQCLASTCKRCTFLSPTLTRFLGTPLALTQEGEDCPGVLSNNTLSRQPLLSLNQFKATSTHVSLSSSSMDHLLPFLSGSLTFLREATKEISCSLHQGLPGSDELASSLKRLEARTREISTELADLCVTSGRSEEVKDGPSTEPSAEELVCLIMDGVDEDLVNILDERGQGRVRELQRELMGLQRRMERVVKGLSRGREGATRHLLYLLVHEMWGKIVSLYHQKHSLPRLIVASLDSESMLQQGKTLHETNRVLVKRVDDLELELFTTRDQADSLLSHLSLLREALDRAHREIESLRRESSLMASEGRVRARRLELKEALGLTHSIDQGPCGRGDESPGGRDESDQGCPVCWTRKNDRVAFGCGHQSCQSCGEKLVSCPLCRVPITLRIKLF